jgi:hypothetical protein
MEEWVSSELAEKNSNGWEEGRCVSGWIDGDLEDRKEEV